MNKQEISESYGISLTQIDYSIRYLKSLQRKVVRIQGVVNKGLIIQNVQCIGRENEYSTFIMVYNNEIELLDVTFRIHEDPTLNILCFQGSDDVYKYHCVDYPLFKYSLQFRSYKKIDFIILFFKLAQLLQSIQGYIEDSVFDLKTIFEKTDGKLFLDQLNLIDFQNSLKDQQDSLIVEEEEENNVNNKGNGVFKLGIIFLEILGLKLDNSVLNDIKQGIYGKLTDLQHQDIIKFIINGMICQQEEKRIKLIDLQYLLRLAFINQSDMLLSEKCEFIQSQIHLNPQEFLNQLSFDLGRGTKQRITIEIKKQFSNLLQLYDFNVNGCIIKSISNMGIQFQVVGQEGSLFQDYLLEFVIQIADGYPFKCPQVKMISDIKSLPFINNKRMIVINILNNEWSLAFNIRTVIISILSVFNANLSDETFFCETNTQEIQERLMIEKDSLEKFSKIFQEYQLKLINKYSDLLLQENILLKQNLLLQQQQL